MSGSRAIGVGLLSILLLGFLRTFVNGMARSSTLPFCKFCLKGLRTEQTHFL